MNKGFTLVELLVTIGVIGVLVGGLLVVINPINQIKKARDTQRRNDLKTIQNALEAYYNDHGYYPKTSGAQRWVNSTAGGYWIPGLDSTYLKSMPKDPLNSGCPSQNNDPRAANCYTYTYFSDPWCGIQGRDYFLVTRLEAYSGTDLSQKDYYDASGNFCSKWSEGPVAGLLNLQAP